ncbi:hypothetical protein [Citricoccus nitrophenolicus]|uniref:hypothetical protein n=1 Tax=Citricoccus nitrophenolicus TaxID=863575 RepID=UPI0039B47A5E
MDCLVSLGLPFPTDREIDSYPEGTRLVGALLTIDLPTVLLDWCGLRADWFADLKASAPAGLGDVFGRGDDRNGSDWTVEFGGAVMEGIVDTQGTHWTVSLPEGQPQLSWYQPDRRGPLLALNDVGGNRVRLESTTGLVLHETLSRLFRDVARAGAQ